jgi:DNA polymerase-4
MHGKGSARHATTLQPTAYSLRPTAFIESCPAEGREDDAVLHADIDAFFASVEQLHAPWLRGRPVVVGAGVIASCSYEARRFGLHAGMPLRRARELCPGAVFLDGDRSVYEAYADKVFRVLRSFLPEVETHFDEAYGSMAGLGIPAGERLAFGREVRGAVQRGSGLSVTVGIGPGRLAAKIAGKTVKPGGVRAVTRPELVEIMTPLPVGAVPGVGTRTRRVLSELNVRTVADLRRLDRSVLGQVFGERGRKLYDLCRGKDDRPCRTPGMPRTISRETTFHRETSDRGEIEGMLYYLCERAARAARAIGALAATVGARIRTADLRGDAAHRRLAAPSDGDREIFRAARELVWRIHRRRVNLRLVGVVLSGLVPRPAGEQLELFRRPRDRTRGALYHALDEIRGRWGHSALVAGRSLHLLGQLRQDEHGFVLRTPSLTK